MLPEILVEFNSRPTNLGYRPVQTEGVSVVPGVSAIQKCAFWMVWLLVFVTPWENAIVLPGIGTISRIIGVATLLFGLFAVFESGRLRVLSGPHYLMVLFVLWVSLTYFWTGAQERTGAAIRTFLQLLLMVWLIWEFAQTHKEQMLLLRAYVLGTCISSAAILTGYFTGLGAMNGRYTGFGFNPLDIALILALSLPISLFLANHDRRRFWVLLYATQFILAISAILLTASRGALLACSPTLLMVPFVYGRLSGVQRAVGGLFVVIVIVFGVFLVPESSWSRLASIGQEVRGGTFNDRTLIWQTGWQVFTQSPFLGVGARAYAPSIERAIGIGSQAPGQEEVTELVAHNTFLSVLVELGVIGFALFASLLVALMYSAWRRPAGERLLWLSVLLTWLIGVSSLTWEDRKPTWFLFAILIAAAASQVSARDSSSRAVMDPSLDQNLRRFQQA